MNAYEKEAISRIEQVYLENRQKSKHQFAVLDYICITVIALIGIILFVIGR